MLLIPFILKEVKLESRVFHTERQNNFLSLHDYLEYNQMRNVEPQSHHVFSGKQLCLRLFFNVLPVQSILQAPSSLPHYTFSVVEGCLWGSTPFLFPNHSYRNECKINALRLYFIQQDSNTRVLAARTRTKALLQIIKFFGKNL